MSRKLVTIALKLAFAAGLIIWIVQRGGLDPKALAIALEPKAFLLLGGLVFAQIWINNWRWLVLLRGQGFATSQRQTLPLSLIGLFFNYAMPGSVGGDLIKGYYLTRDFPDKKVAAAVSVLMDRLIGFFVMVFSASLTILAFRDRLDHDPRLMAIGTGTVLITLGFILVLGFSLSRRLQMPLKAAARVLSWFLPRKLFRRVYRVFRDIYYAMHSYRYRLGDLAKTFVLSVIGQSFVVGFFYTTAVLLGEGDIPLSVFWFCIPLGLVVQAVPIAPAGVGVGQAVFFFLFQAILQKPTQVGTVAVTLIQVFQFAIGLIGAWFYLKQSAKGQLPSNAELKEASHVSAK